jgi:hypothetical protein
MKFIRSFFDDKKSIIKIEGCQHCPLMKFKIIDSVCVCRSFLNNGINIVEPWVLNYTDTGLILDKINIPNWCKLPNDLEELKKNRTCYKPFISSVLIDPNDLSNDDELPFINLNTLSITNSKKVYDYLLSLVDKSSSLGFYTNSKNVYNNIDNINSEKYNINKIKHEVCSYCGEEDETVKRDINIGMCNDCWGLFNEDEEKKKQSFINNFRMKRKNKFDYNKTFKIIKEIKI